jgi:hypothetical protein
MKTLITEGLLTEAGGGSVRTPSPIVREEMVEEGGSA